MRDVGKNIRQLRLERKLTQDDLAEQLHVTRQTVSNYETGKSKPDIDMMVEISAVLKTDIQTIIYGPEPKVKDYRMQRILIGSIMTMVLGVLIVLLRPTAEEIARNQFSLVLVSLLNTIMKPLFFLLVGWISAAVLGMAIKKGSFRGRWARRIGSMVTIFLVIWFALSGWYFSGQAPDWLGRCAYRVYVFFYRISVPYYSLFVFTGAALWLCGFPAERKRE